MLPRWITFTLISLAVLSLLPLALVARARQSRSEQPRIHLVANPAPLSNGKADLLQADQIGRHVQQLGDQQMTALPPAVGPVA